MSDLAAPEAMRLPLAVEIHRRHGLLELVVRGALDDEGGPALVTDLVAAHDAEVREVRVDLSSIRVIDPAGLLALDRCRAYVAARGGRFVIADPNRALDTIDLRDGSRT